MTGQLSWNVLLRKVHGGDTIIYDRPWNGAADNAAFRKAFPGYAFQPSAVQGRICKALRAIEGDLTFFNSRYGFFFCFAPSFAHFLFYSPGLVVSCVSYLTCVKQNTEIFMR